MRELFLNCRPARCAGNLGYFGVAWGCSGIVDWVIPGFLGHVLARFSGLFGLVLGDVWGLFGHVFGGCLGFAWICFRHGFDMIMAGFLA